MNKNSPGFVSNNGRAHNLFPPVGAQQPSKVASDRILGLWHPFR